MTLTPRGWWHCTQCEGTLWTCEDHPHRPWRHDVGDGIECGGAGDPCQRCNPSGAVPGYWRPLDRAPASTWVLLWVPRDADTLIGARKDRSVIGIYQDDEWSTDAGRLVSPSHWMSLPQPPR